MQEIVKTLDLRNGCRRIMGFTRNNLYKQMHEQISLKQDIHQEGSQSGIPQGKTQKEDAKNVYKKTISKIEKSSDK